MADYDPHADSLGSYLVAIEALRERHRAECCAVVARLWRERQQRRISRPVLASKLGVAASTLQAWERGKGRPAPDVLAQWKCFLGILSSSSTGVRG